MTPRFLKRPGSKNIYDNFQVTVQNVTEVKWKWRDRKSPNIPMDIPQVMENHLETKFPDLPSSKKRRNNKPTRKQNI